MSEDGREQQRALYGEPLGDLTGRVQAGLGFTQARLATALGLSAPMLNQLISGKRVKIGNPQVVRRLEALLDLAGQASELPADEIEARVAAIQSEQLTLADATTSPAHREDAGVAALAAAASATELDRLATLTDAPELAALLRAAARRHG